MATTSKRQQKSNLRLQVQGLAKSVPVNKARRFKLRITNSGTRPVRAIRLSLSGTRGLAVNPSKRSIKELKAGRTLSVNVSVRANRRAPAHGRVLVTANARGAGTARLARQLRVVRGGAGQKAGASVNSPAGHYFWAFEDIRVDRSSDPIGFYFANDRFVHVGLPKGGLPNCSRANAKRDSDGNIESGCVRYTFNPRSGALRIDKLRGKFTAKKGKSSVEFDDKTYYLATIPKAGSRIQTTLINRGFRGMCGLILGCTTWKENLGLDNRGRFVRSRSSITSMGGAGAPFVWGASFPPDEYGTYRILGKGRIQLRFQDGSVSTETIAVQHDSKGRPDPVKEGLILDDTWFYPEDDD